MLGLKQFLKKENRMCPICIIPYVRKRRVLKAGYFDISYTIAAWTLRCPECGYEVILPGTARIQVTEDAKQSIGDSLDDAVQPMVSITRPAMQMDETDNLQDAIEEMSAEDGEPAADDMGSSMSMPQEPDVADAAENTEAAEEPSKGISSPNDGVKPGDEIKPSQTGETAADACEGLADLAGPTNTQKPSGSERVEKPAGGHHDGTMAEQGDSEEPQKALSKDNSYEGTRKTAQKDKKAGTDTTNDKAMETNQATPDKKPEQEKTLKGRDRKERQQKGAGDLCKKQPAAQGITKPHTPDIRPTPRYSQPGTFQGRGPSGFPGSSMFPSSAINNVDVLTASVRLDTVRNGGGKKEDAIKPAQVQEKAALKPANDRGSRAESTAEKKQAAAGTKTKDTEKPSVIPEKQNILAAMRRPDNPVPPQSGRFPVTSQPDRLEAMRCSGKRETASQYSEAAVESQADGFADNKNPEGQNKGEKVLSAKKEAGASELVSSARKPEKEGKKDLSAGSGETGETDEDGKAVKEPQANGKAQENKKDEPAIETERLDDTSGKDSKETAAGADKGEEKKADADTVKKLQEKIPAGIAEKIPLLSQISKQQKRSIFISEEKRYLEEHVPHKQSIVNDLIYDTDNSEMFLRTNGQYGLDRPCVHYNYRTQNGNFFRCTVKYKQDDAIRVLDIMEVKRMLEDYPDLYKKFFPDSISDA